MANIILIVNKKRINSLQELRDNFKLPEVISYLQNRRLSKWLLSINEDDVEKQLQEIAIDTSNEETLDKLCRILDLSEDIKNEALASIRLTEEKEQAALEAEVEAQKTLSDDFSGIALSDSTFLKMVQIPTGSFIMGPGRKGYYDGSQKRTDSPAHKVTFTKTFWCSTMCISVAQRNVVIGDKPEFADHKKPSLDYIMLMGVCSDEELWESASATEQWVGMTWF